MKTPRSFGTHSGTFHADEVTACALFLLFDLIDLDKIYRTRDQALLEECFYVCDVGGIYDPYKNLFDHHQASYKGELSSAGMVMLHFKQKQLISEALYDYLCKTLIHGIDAHDNGRSEAEPGVCTFSNVISNFVPARYDACPEEQDTAFFRAVDFALGHLQRSLQRFNYMQSCKKKVIEAMATNQKYLLFDEPLPWIDAFFENGGEFHKAEFVIMPSVDHWKLRGIPPVSSERMKVRVPQPLSWAGLLDEELRKASGIEGAIFCHKGRFISVWKTKEDVFKALDVIIKKGGL
jgi:uncharacterized UPF0160 family protein